MDNKMLTAAEILKVIRNHWNWFDPGYRRPDEVICIAHVPVLFSPSLRFIHLVLAVILCGFPAYGNEPDIPEIVALVPKDWPPQYHTDKDGKPFGFAIEIMNEVAKVAGYGITYKAYPNFSVTVDALIAGEGDLIPNSGILDDRKDRFIFTSPIETFYVSVFVRSEETEIGKFDDLVGNVVGVVEKNVGLFMLKDRTDLTLRIERSLQDALFSLISGNSDALLYPSSVVFSMARSARIEGRIKMVGSPIREVKRGIRLLKGNEILRDRLQQAVKSFVKTDKYLSIYQKWYGRPKPLFGQKEMLIIFTAAIVLLSISLILWRQISLRRLNQVLKRQNDKQVAYLDNLLGEKEILVQEIHHRVKNNLQVILSMLSLQRRASKSDHERLALTESDRRIRVMAKLYEHLYQAEDVTNVNAKDYLKSVFDDALAISSPDQSISGQFISDDIYFDIKTATTCAQIVSELVSNSVKHAFPTGTGTVSLSITRSDGGNVRLRVSDDGIGMNMGLDETKLGSMGLKLVNALIVQLGGSKTIECESGTKIEIRFRETSNV
jgi:two-component sensor histidine kinase